MWPSFLIVAAAILFAFSTGKCPRCEKAWYGDDICFKCQVDVKGSK